MDCYTSESLVGVVEGSWIQDIEEASNRDILIIDEDWLDVGALDQYVEGPTGECPYVFKSHYITVAIVWASGLWRTIARVKSTKCNFLDHSWGSSWLVSCKLVVGLERPPRWVDAVLTWTEMAWISRHPHTTNFSKLVRKRYKHVTTQWKAKNQVRKRRRSEIHGIVCSTQMEESFIQLISKATQPSTSLRTSHSFPSSIHKSNPSFPAFLNLQCIVISLQLLGAEKLSIYYTLFSIQSCQGNVSDFEKSWVDSL